MRAEAVVARGSIVVDGNVEGGQRFLQPALEFGGSKTARERTFPTLSSRRAPTEGMLAIIRSGSKLPDWPKVKDIDAELLLESTKLPPGAYGRITIKNASFVLGSPDAAGPQRYDLESLDLLAGGRILLDGPVILTVGSLGMVQGTMGREDLPEWLEIRVESGPVRIARGAAVFGHLFSPRSNVQLLSGAQVKGWVATDSLQVERGARLRGQDSTSVSLIKIPRQRRGGLARGATILEERMARFLDNSSSGATAELQFVDDVPSVTIKGAASKLEQKGEAAERAAYFELVALVLLNTDFEEVRIRAGTESQLRASLGMGWKTVRKSDFEGHLVALGEKESAGENVRIIQASPVLQSIFLERSVAVANARSLRR